MVNNNKLITVEVAYATPAQQKIICVRVPCNSTITAAILASGIVEVFPNIDLTNLHVGIFSKPRDSTDIVKDGDRIEIYRPLLIDPKEARRAKAKRAKK